jgi:hypothetical protein
MVAAIVIMPKSYLPALKRFSQSKMARNIKILRARIELQDGNMTAVHSKKFLQFSKTICKPLRAVFPGGLIINHG